MTGQQPHRRTRRRIASASGVLSLGLATMWCVGCAPGPSGAVSNNASPSSISTLPASDPLQGSRSGGSGSDQTPGQPTIEEEVDLGNAKQPRPYDDLLARAIADNEGWWATEFPGLYRNAYTPLTGKVYASYPARSDPIPGCSGAEETTAEELAAYVAFYCADSDFLAYDDGPESGFVNLSEQYGASVVAVIISHEWAHAIQRRAGVFDRDVPTVYTEQHADCVAGAWVGRAYRGESNLIRFDDADVRGAILAIAEVRDPVGASQFDQDAHGLAFDRVGAFQVGFSDGAAACVDLIDHPLPLTRNEFVPYSDEAHTGGDAPFSCEDETAECEPAPDFLARDLNDYWSERIDNFPILAVDMDPETPCSDGVPVGDGVLACASANTIDDDLATARQRHREIGDFSNGYLYGLAWAEIALTIERSGLSGEARALARDCMTGQWAADISSDASGSTRRGGAALSPGDLDETLDVVLQIADQTPDDDVLGSPIQKIEALRAGLFGPGCERYRRPEG